jgi:hypothetical protein
MRSCGLSYVQRWSFLIVEQCCGSLAIEKIPGEHCDLSTYLAKRARAAYVRSRTPCWKSNTVRHGMASSRSLSGEPLSSKNKCQEMTFIAEWANETTESWRYSATVAAALASSPQTQRTCWIDPDAYHPHAERKNCVTFRHHSHSLLTPVVQSL